MKSRQMILDVARGYLGAVQGDAKHQAIVNTYNSYVSANKGGKHKGSAYKVKYSDAWCATFVSAIAIMCHDTDIIPTECSCTRMIKLFKELGCFEPDDNYIPNRNGGDIIFYSWNINGKPIPDGDYDVDGLSHHVGIVESCDGKNITVIEGNRDSKCQRRTIPIGWKYIHGFGLPKYIDIASDNAEKTAQEAQEEASNVYKVKLGDNLTKIAKKYNTTVEELRKLNPQIKNPNVIFINQEIRIK